MLFKHAHTHACVMLTTLQATYMYEIYNLVFAHDKEKERENTHLFTLFVYEYTFTSRLTYMSTSIPICKNVSMNP